MRRPSYIYLTDTEWDRRIERLNAIARSCTLCPRNCHVNRHAGETGFCGAPGKPVVSGIFPHHGEEPCISGTGGSGTVFFSYCTLKCCFCQNYQISHEAEGEAISEEDLACRMVRLQEIGCLNINLVTATHFLPWVVRSLRLAARKGLSIPIVYNCGGYEHASTVRLLDGIVDIYLPDMKYGGNRSALRFSGTANYRSFNRSSVREMFRQVGPLRTAEDGIAWRGLCIRHLVLPNNLASSDSLVEFLVTVFDPADVTFSLMAQYRPLYHAERFPELNRMVTSSEYDAVKAKVISAGFKGYLQDLTTINRAFVIDFEQRKEEALTGEDP